MITYIVATQFIAIAETKNITVNRITYRLAQRTFGDVIASIRASQCNIVVAVVDTSGVPFLMREAKAAGVFANGQHQWIFTETMATELVASRLENNNLTASDFQVRHITLNTLET
jgi:hypothetical protein